MPPLMSGSRRRRAALVAQRQGDDAALVEQLALVGHQDSSRARKLSAPSASTRSTSWASAASMCWRMSSRARPHGSRWSPRGPAGRRACAPRARPPAQQHDLPDAQQRRQPRSHVQGVAREVGLRQDLATEGDDDRAEDEGQHAQQDRAHQQRQQHVDGDVAPEDGRQQPAGILAHRQHALGTLVAGLERHLQLQAAEAEEGQVQAGEHGRLTDAEEHAQPDECVGQGGVHAMLGPPVLSRSRRRGHCGSR